MSTTNKLIPWLMDGDPAIRWQTTRDLQGAPAKRWKAEQHRTLNEGWGAQLLALQAPSAFHTTFNVLEGLHEWLETTPKHALRNDVLDAEKSALEFMLEHRLFKSDKTGKIINGKFTPLSYPHRWYYNVLRGLVYFTCVNAPHDERLQDTIELLNSRRRADGTWPVQHKYPGRAFFEMEKVGGPSRWNTLRALRVLQWWER